MRSDFGISMMTMIGPCTNELHAGSNGTTPPIDQVEATVDATWWTCCA